MFKRSSSKGFTLIELLIVVAIIGIIAAIAIPNLLNAIQRGKQKRTMSDMRSVGTAVESYQVDNGVPPNVASSADIQVLAATVTPTFIKQLPKGDGWGRPMDWTYSADEYTVRSFGKDGKTAASLVTGPTTAFNADLMYSNGQFIAFPEGTQN